MVIHLFGLQVPSLPETCLVIHSWNEFEKACYLIVHFYLRSSVCFLLSCRTRITDSFLNLVLFLFLLIFMSTPQIRRSILNEDEYGFRKAKRPIYYDDGLEKTRQTLNAKISQLNSAIDNVSSRLKRGGSNSPAVPVETDPEVEAAM